MKRLVLVVAIALLAGVALNTAAAGLSAAVPRDFAALSTTTQGPKNWPVNVPEIFPLRPEHRATYRSLAYRSVAHTASALVLTGPPPRQSLHDYRTVHVEVGWPLLCVSGRLSESVDRQAGATSQVVHDVDGAYVLPQARALPAQPIVIPLAVHWAPFVTNSLLYGAFAASVVVLHRTLRRVSRLRRGRCPGCGYPRPRYAVCPECGTTDG